MSEERETKEIRRDIELNMKDTLSQEFNERRGIRLQVVSTLLIAEVLLGVRDALHTLVEVIDRGKQ